ncbi:MAG: hypothetical protein Q9P01_00420, partial [Anaerolineae bacterium]|nr:hypothetical protein [Anaerolineae bacterium]
AYSLPVKTLMFWMWQRWEVEVCHRELKSNFGLGNKQCHNPHAAVSIGSMERFGSIPLCSWLATALGV